MPIEGPQATINHEIAPIERRPAMPAICNARVQRDVERFSRVLGLPVYCCDARDGRLVYAAESVLVPSLPVDMLRSCIASRQSAVQAISSDLNGFAIPLDDGVSDGLAICGYSLAKPRLRPTELVLAAASMNWSEDRFSRWIDQAPACDVSVLERLVAMAVVEQQQTLRNDSVCSDCARIAEQLDHSYEELNLLHRLTQNMHISQSPRETVALSLDRIAGVIQAEGHAVWLDDKRDGRMFQIEGRLPFDEMGMARLIARFDGNDWPRQIIRNNVAGTLLGADFPGLRNFALVAIVDGNLRFGWICSCNFTGGQSFGSIQASLLSSVASILGTHQHNLELYRQHEDLLLGFVRSLVSTLDAKDSYTRGHSDRVALIARRLGANLGLPAEDLRDIYLSGLLHDIGKIGIDDQILRKSGALTREEFEHVKQHPVIGYNILAGLRNLRAVLPGVRHHHESFGGTGYPDGLRGEEIPLMARVIAVADSYDAMASDRPYRRGLRVDEIETILRDGAGRQWDPRVVSAYFAEREHVLEICSTYSVERSNLLALTIDDAGCDDPINALRTIDVLSATLRAEAVL